MNKTVFVSVFISLLLASGSLSAKPSLLQFSYDKGLKKVPADIFDTGRKYPIKGKSVYFFLAKKSFKERKHNECLEHLKKISRKNVNHPWILAQELECLISSGKKGRFTRITQLLVKGKKNRWFDAKRPFAPRLNKLRILAQIELLKTQKRLNRDKAWLTFEKVLSQQSKLNNNQMSVIYSVAGELAFSEQNLGLAVSMFKLSLAFEPNKTIQKKLDLILGKKSREKKSETLVYKDLSPSEEEAKLLVQIDDFYKNKNYISVLEDSIKYLNKFNNSKNSEGVIKKVKGIFYLLSKESNNQKLFLVKDKAKTIAKKLSGSMLSKLGDGLYFNEKYDLARDIFSAIKNANGDKHIDIKAYFFLAKSQHYLGAYDKALEDYQKVIFHGFGSEYYYEALYMSGLVYLRKDAYLDASGYFEKLIISGNRHNFELSSLYFLYRIKEKLKASDKEEILTKITNKYPLTYYGLTLKRENGLSLIPKKKKIKSLAIWLSADQKKSWKRFALLIQYGWFEEANLELDYFLKPHSPESWLVYLKLKTYLGEYNMAVEKINNFWDKGKFYSKNTFELSYPLIYEPIIRKEVKKYGLEENIIKAIIKQESAFKKDAVSSSNAAGLMQLVRITANEVARDLKIRGYRFPESLFKPKVNIKLGVTYFKRMYNSFDGNVPFALAAYNAGIGNIKSWAKYRNLIDANNKNSMSLQADIWVEELPWSETRFYIKAILRNYIVYKTLAKKSLAEPVWKDVVIAK